MHMLVASCSMCFVSVQLILVPFTIVAPRLLEPAQVQFPNDQHRLRIPTNQAALVRMAHLTPKRCLSSRRTLEEIHKKWVAY